MMMRNYGNYGSDDAHAVHDFEVAAVTRSMLMKTLMLLRLVMLGGTGRMMGL